MTTPDLKPCPFCGMKPLVFYIPPHDHYIADFPRYEGAGAIECLECGAAMMGKTEKEVIEKWNRRASDEN